MDDFDLAKRIAKDLLEAVKRDPKLKKTVSAAAELVASLELKSDRQSANVSCQTDNPPISPPSSSSGQSVSQSINGTPHSSMGAYNSVQTPQRAASSTSGSTPFLRLLGNSAKSARVNHRFHPYGVTINPQVFPSKNIPCPASPCATQTVSTTRSSWTEVHGLYKKFMDCSCTSTKITAGPFLP
ncbi:hypothetical protein PRIPAC_94586 [Pristionchus pacificus]|uniref:Uncharacterized protein n=1 Tax=Pristionchus pacificus TaxID=54126 RepID=A0A2A6BBQ6_PRIPA|nr:hypothetical protein PRIPAC_94586 [Pristionchus pacificus]|eukprot:PDM63294.1 hypothetical protein PRIPAC_50509 [Pristionchus pacificus]